MIRAGYILIAVLFVATLWHAFMLVGNGREQTRLADERRELDRAAKAPGADDTVYQRLDAVRQRALTLEAQRARDFRRLTGLGSALVVLALGLSLFLTLSSSRRVLSATPVEAEVLSVHRMGKIRNGCPVFAVRLTLVGGETEGTSEIATKVMVCETLPEVQGAMVAVLEEQIRVGRKLWVRYDPAYGGTARIVPDAPSYR